MKKWESDLIRNLMVSVPEVGKDIAEKKQITPRPNKSCAPPWSLPEHLAINEWETKNHASAREMRMRIRSIKTSRR